MGITEGRQKRLPGPDTVVQFPTGKKASPAEVAAVQIRMTIVDNWNELWEDGKDPFRDGVLQTPEPQSVLGDYRFPFQPIDDNGKYSPVGWLIKRTLFYSDGNPRKITPYEAIYNLSRLLDIPVAQAELVRVVTEVNPPATKETVQKNLIAGIAAPQFLVPSWPRLEDFARKIDGLDKTGWQKVEEKMQDQEQKYNGEHALTIIEAVTVPVKHFVDANELIRHIFETAAYLSRKKAYPDSTLGYSENPAIYAAGTAALEIAHQEELTERGFSLPSLGLFSPQIF